MKNLITLIIFLCFYAANNSFAAFTSENGNSSSAKEELSKNQFGLGLSIAKKFNTINSILTQNDTDYLFNEIGVFVNYYGDAIDYNYGTNLSFGYGYKKLGIYVNGGYLITNFDYIANNISENHSEGSGFFGAGTSYEITDNLKAKLDFMKYSFNFTPTNSNITQKTRVDIKSATLGLQFNF